MNTRRVSRRSTAATGFKGVYPTTSKKHPFKALVVHRYKSYYLGSFETAEEASQAVTKFEDRLPAMVDAPQVPCRCRCHKENCCPCKDGKTSTETDSISSKSDSSETADTPTT